MVQHNQIDHTGITGVPTAVSYASNSNDVSSAGAAGASTLVSRADHVHRGVRSISHTSNTFFGNVTLTASGTLGITSPSSGTFDFSATGGGGGGGGGGSITVKEVDGTPNVSGVSTIRVSNGTLTDDGAGQVTIATAPASTGARYPVQSAVSGSASANSRAATLGATPANGNDLILVSVSEATRTITSVTATNVTWTLLATSDTGTAPIIEIWHGAVGASGGTTVTANYSGTDFCAIVVAEWSGLTGTLNTSAARNTTTDPVASHPIAILENTVATALVVTGVSTVSNATTFTTFAGPYMAYMGATGQTVGALYAWPGLNAVYGTAGGGNHATATSLTVSIS